MEAENYRKAKKKDKNRAQRQLVRQIKEALIQGPSSPSSKTPRRQRGSSAYTGT